MLRTIGLMSGTSLDGVDAAYLETDGEVIARFGPRQTLPYDPALRRALRSLLDRAENLTPNDPELLDATRRLTERHAEAVEAIGLPADLIGFHGQTILHRPAAPGEPQGLAGGGGRLACGVGSHRGEGRCDGHGVPFESGCSNGCSNSSQVLAHRPATRP